MPPTSNAWRNADRLADGQLASLLIRLRKEEGRSFEEIARMLWADLDIAVSVRGLLNWCRQLGTEERSKAAS